MAHGLKARGRIEVDSCQPKGPSSIVKSNATHCKSYIEEETAGYTFNDGIPKNALFVKLNPNISDSKRDFITNGIRNFFQDQTTIMLETNDIV